MEIVEKTIKEAEFFLNRDQGRVGNEDKCRLLRRISGSRTFLAVESKADIRVRIDYDNRLIDLVDALNRHSRF